jgi:hypothetical protein
VAVPKEGPQEMNLGDEECGFIFDVSITHTHIYIYMYTYLHNVCCIYIYQLVLAILLDFVGFFVSGRLESMKNLAKFGFRFSSQVFFSLKVGCP